TATTNPKWKAEAEKLWRHTTLPVIETGAAGGAGGLGMATSAARRATSGAFAGAQAANAAATPACQAEICASQVATSEINCQKGTSSAGVDRVFAFTVKMENTACPNAIKLGCTSGRSTLAAASGPISNRRARIASMNC